MKYAFSILSTALLLMLLSQCAKQTQPTGGPKDETPPKLLQTNPPDRTVNFNRNEIELDFDEAIQINNPREQLLVTPSIGKKYEMTARKNKAVLKLNADLLPNTTYTLSFRESIQDLTERNSVTNLKLAFSTGEFIDSISVSGNVYDILEGTPVKNYIVAAVLYNDTTDIFKHEAAWITITDEKGYYILENLKQASYIFYAFEDKNKNLIVDSKSERYGFIAETIQLDSTIKALDIPIYKLDARPLKLISAKPLTAYFNIRFSKGLDRYEIKPLDSIFTIISKADDAETIKLYNTLGVTDSTQIRLIATDSLQNKVDTLLYIKFEKRETPKDKFNVKHDEVKFLQSTGRLNTSIEFSKPILKYLTDSIYIQLDSVNYIHFKNEDLTWNSNQTKVLISKAIPKESDFSKNPVSSTQRGSRDSKQNKETTTPPKQMPVYNQLILGKGTFISVELDSNSYSKSTITTLTPENTAIVSVKVDTKEAVITELVGSKKIEATSTTSQTRFENIPPAEYYIRVIVDHNKNGKWDPGNFYTKESAESILFYSNEKGQKNIMLKANWELGPLLITPK
jgi:hypothetical protein